MQHENNKTLTEEMIIEIINDFLEAEFEVDRSKIIPSADLKSTLELDSLDYIDLVVVMEKNLHIKVDPADLIDIHSMQDLYNYVISKMGIKA
ncbi:MAG TPA: acyl carrier protein [Chitinophagaceae bacterium]|jgi:acyl carrier protein|nr:acyl carrier protein [Chitinophagaceae bacterium]